MDVISYLLGKNAGGSGGGDLNWSAVGYTVAPQTIIKAYNKAIEIKNNWTENSRLYDYKGDKELIIAPVVDTSSKTSFSYFANSCRNLLEIPLLNTSNVTNMENAFSSCSVLTTIPVFNTSKVTNMSSMFMYTPKLTNESLDNVLQMCINATSYTGTKTLYQLGFRKSDYAVAIIEALPHYQAFIDAGWTIGY